MEEWISLGLTLIDSLQMASVLHQNISLYQQFQILIESINQLNINGPYSIPHTLTNFIPLNHPPPTAQRCLLSCEGAVGKNDYGFISIWGLYWWEDVQQYLLKRKMGCAKSSEHNEHVCCPPGSWPALQLNYQPKGKTNDIGGLTLYEVGSGNKALVLFEDIFGIDSGRHKTVADTYATLGFKVYLPEFLEPIYKGSIEDVPKILEVVGQQKMATIKAKYEKLSAYIKTQGSDTVLAAGFCWGAWTAFRMSADYGNIRAIAGIHPSLNVQNFYGGNEVKLVESVRCPAFFYACSNDQPGTKKGGEYVKILERKFGAEKVGSEEFPNQVHGFLMRADPGLEAAKADTEKIIKMSIEYFSRFP